MSQSSTLGPLPPEAVLGFMEPDADLIVPLANGEAVSLLDAVEAAADSLGGVRVHQMHVLPDRGYLEREAPTSATYGADWPSR